jgi:hypothetical protein
MAKGLGKRIHKELLDYIFNGTSMTAAPSNIYISLHTADPGSDGQTSNEATGSGYARKSTAASDWAAATDNDPSLMTNSNAITFATATGDWSSGTNFTHAGFWSSLSGTSESDFLGRIQLTTPTAVTNGDTAEFAAGDFDVSIGATS